MKTTLSKLILMPVFLLLVSCESMDGSIYTADHSRYNRSFSSKCIKLCLSL